MELILGFILGMLATYAIFGCYQWLLTKYKG